MPGAAPSSTMTPDFDDFPVIGGHSGVRLATLVTIRWLAVGGQLVTLLFVRYGLDLPIDLPPAIAAVAASALLNSLVLLRYGAVKQLTDRQAALQLAFDLVQLAFLLCLTGGLTNPFSLLMVVPVTISATVLSRRSTAMLLVLALLLSAFLALMYIPLPWRGGSIELPPIYLFGLWAGLAFSMLFLALYAGRVSEEARRRAGALAATQAALAREQRLAELGTLAAAAAHELGTPLGTITLAAQDLLQEMPEDDPRHEDLSLINSQAMRCRTILEQLSQRRPAADEHPFAYQPLEAIAREAARPFEAFSDVTLTIHTARQSDDGSQPVMRRRPEILHALTNFIENAVSFARSRVDIELDWDARQVRMTITDDGPGFDPAVLRSLGEPYVTTRHGTDTEAGLGLGIFIAKTLLERTGARVSFVNTSTGGACVSLRWTRADLEADRTGDSHDRGLSG